MSGKIEALTTPQTGLKSEALAEARNNLQKLYLNAELEKSIGFVLLITEENFAQNRFDVVDTILGEIEWNKLNSVIIEGLLRSAYRFQHVLKNYQKAIDGAKEAIDPSEKWMFAGLF